jgi:hypothetical protein
MSILSDAFSKRITWTTAATQIGQWFAQILGPNASGEAAQQAGALMSDLKQAASDAIGLADTALGPILAAGALAVEGAADTALKAAIGPAATIITPAIDAAITQAENALVAAIKARSVALRASLAQHPQS